MGRRGRKQMARAGNKAQARRRLALDRAPTRQPRKRKTPRMPQCQNKVRYRDQYEAAQAMRRVNTGRTDDNLAVRVYECPRCHGFHMTSRASW